MNTAVFTTIAVTGFTVAFFHAAIPTHWLPFVLAARAQRWHRSKTLLVTALAGLGHVLFTTILGVIVVWLGIGLDKKVGNSFPLIAGGALVAFGLYYLIRQFRGGGHGHHHFFGGHSHSHSHAVEDSHEHGEHGGMLVNTGHGFIEVSVFETNVPPRFRLYFYDSKKKQVPASKNETVTIEIIRPGNERQLFEFKWQEDYLESTSNIPEPHEFKALLKQSHGGHSHTFEIQFTEHGHDHDHDHGHHHPHEHDHSHEHPSALREERTALAAGQQPKPTSDWVAIGSLFALLTFSPCEGFLPVYLTGIKYGWMGFVLLSSILAGATLAGMVIFTWLTLIGLEKLKLKFFEKYEMGILGGLLCVLGLLVIVFEH